MTGEWVIERLEVARAHVSSAAVGDWLDRWKALRRAGWQVTVVVANDNSHLVGFGYRELWN